MDKSDAPKRQDNTADHSNNPQNRSPLGNSPSRVGGGPPPPPEHNNTNGDSSQPPWWARLETYKFVGEVLLVIIGIYVACVYSGQLKQMVESNKISRESLESVQRAFITFQYGVPDRVTGVNAGHAHKFTESVQNSGATPALSAIKFNNFGTQEPDEAAFRGAVSDFIAVTIGPHQVQGTAARFIKESEIFGEDLGDIAQHPPPKKPFYAWAWMAYRDVFGHPHITEMCIQFAPIAITARGPLMIDWETSMCNKHNCTDEYCQDYKELESFLPAPPT